MRKITLITVITAFAITTLTFTSCTTTDDNTEATPAAPATPIKIDKELLTANYWVKTAITLNGVDDFSKLDACEKDGIDKFFKSGKYIFDYETLCPNETDQAYTSTWELTDNETVLKRADGYTFTVKELTETKLVTEEKSQNGDIKVITYKTVPTYASIIINANGWKLTSEIRNGQEVITNMAECDKDNIFMYKADFTVTENEGATKCDPNNPDIKRSGTWEFSEDETRIKIGVLTQVPLQIVKLSPTQLTISTGGPDNTFTYTAQ